MAIDLFPCPGCGSAAYLRPYRGIWCSNEACWWEVTGIGGESEAELAAQWNQRVASVHEDRVAALVALATTVATGNAQLERMHTEQEALRKAGKILHRGPRDTFEHWLDALVCDAKAVLASLEKP